MSQEPSVTYSAPWVNRLLAGAVALSGMAFVAAYLAGRLYLAAYYGVFGIDVGSLELSTEDIVFASFLSVFPSIGFAWGALNAIRPVAPRAGAPPAWLVRLAPTLRVLAWGWGTILLLPIGAILLAVALIFDWPDTSVEWAETLSLAFFLWVIPIVLVPVHLAVSAPVPPGDRLYLGILAVGLCIFFVPFISGTLEGIQDRDEVGSDSVTVRVSTPIEDWKQVGEGYESGPAVILGSGVGTTIVWVFDERRVYYVPVGEVLLIRQTEPRP